MRSSRFSALIGLFGGGLLVIVGLKFIIPVSEVVGDVVTLAAMVIVLLSAYVLIGATGVDTPGRPGGDQYSNEN
jgi:hypothetical protein